MRFQFAFVKADDDLLLLAATYFVKLPRIENSCGIPKAKGDRGVGGLESGIWKLESSPQPPSLREYIEIPISNKKK